MVVMDPKMTKLARHASEWLRHKPGYSVAVLNAMMKTIIDEDLHDKEAEKFQGFPQLKEKLEAYTPEQVAESTGLSAERIREAARGFAKSEKRLLCMTLGDSENAKGVNNALAAANLLILVGSGPEDMQLPAEYADTLGMFEVGIRPDAGPGHSPVAEKGLDAEAMLYAEDSPIKALYIMGENVLVTFPRVHDVERKLGELELLVVQDIIMNDTVKMAHVVLPASSWAEKEVTMVGATGIPQNAIKCVPETGTSVPDWKIIRNLARTMQKDLGHGGLEDIREEMQKKVSFDFDVSDASPAFNPVEQEIAETVDAEYPVTMVTGILMQHSGSLTTLSKSLGSVVSDAYAQVNDQDAGRMNIHDEGYIKISSRRGELLLKARVTDEVPEGMVFIPAHFPHARVNALTMTPENGIPRISAVKVEPVS